MTGGIFMAIVGAYLLSYGNLTHNGLFLWVGPILVTIGFVISWHYEDDYRYYIEKLQKEIDSLKGEK